MKSILEKEVSLEGKEMQPFTEDNMICLYSGHVVEFMDEQQQQLQVNTIKKKAGKMPLISMVLTGMNIEEYTKLGQFERTNQRQKDHITKQIENCQQKIKQQAEEAELEESFNKLPKKLKKQKTK